MEINLNLEKKLRDILDKSVSVHETLRTNLKAEFRYASYKVYEFYKKLEKQEFSYTEKDLDYCLKILRKLNKVSKKIPKEMEEFKNSVKYLLTILDNKKKKKVVLWKG